MSTTVDPSEPDPNDRSPDPPPSEPETEDTEGDLDDLPRPAHLQQHE
jgi:hypothetical protein